MNATSLQDRMKNNGRISRNHIVEIKLLIVLLYYMLFASFFFISFGIFFSSQKHFHAELKKYFVCEALGNEECDRSAIESFSFPILLNLTIYIFIAVPTVSLVYVVSWTDARRVSNKLSKKASLLFTSLSTIHEGDGSIELAN